MDEVYSCLFLTTGGLYIELSSERLIICCIIQIYVNKYLSVMDKKSNYISSLYKRMRSILFRNHINNANKHRGLLLLENIFGTTHAIKVIKTFNRYRFLLNVC